MNEIPWTQIGAFGSFAIVILILVFGFVLKWKKSKNSGNPTAKFNMRCLNDARLQSHMTDTVLTKESMTEMKQDMKDLCVKTVEQTGILKGLFSETKDQTKVLEKIASKIGNRR